MAKIKFNNGIAYAKRAMCTDVDACNCVGASQSVSLTNGMLVTLGKMNDDGAEGKGYVFDVTPTTANTATDVWMVITPAVSMDLKNNQFIDPRAYSAEIGRPVDLVRPMPNTDYFHVSIEVFNGQQKPDLTTNKYVTAEADGVMKAVNTANSVEGIIFECIAIEPIPVGQEMVEGFVLKCLKNPAPTIS